MPRKQRSVQKNKHGAYQRNREVNLKELPMAKLEQPEQQNK